MMKSRVGWQACSQVKLVEWFVRQAQHDPGDGDVARADDIQAGSAAFQPFAVAQQQSHILRQPVPGGEWLGLDGRDSPPGIHDLQALVIAFIVGF